MCDLLHAHSYAMPSRFTPGQPMLDRPCRDLGARCNAKFGKNVLDMLGDRSLAQHQCVGEGAVREPARDQDSHLALARGQPVIGLFCGPPWRWRWDAW